MIVTVDTEALKEALKSKCNTMCIDQNTSWCEHSCPLKRIEELLDKAMVDVAKPQDENKPLNWLDRCDDHYLSEN